MDWNDLPAPIARYLQLVLPAETPRLRRAVLQQTGRLRTSVHAKRWMRFEATHSVVPPSGRFVWNARVSIAPLVHVQVIDSLVDGEGAGKVLLMSVLPVASDAGTPAMNASSLHRYLAEAVWYPTALLPSDDLTWTAIDDHKALATLSASGTTVSLEFRFNDSGQVVGIYSPGRWRRFRGRYEQCPWEGHFKNYVRRGGILVPQYGEVGWYEDGKWEPVWEGSVVEFAYE